jgi:hypothetical protein
MKTRVLLWGFVSVLSVGIAGEPLSGADRPQVIQLDAATKLTLLGVTYGGGQQRAPGFERFARFNPIYCPADSTMVWIQVDHESGNWPSFELVIYDKAKTGCVTTERRSGSHIKDGVEVHGFVLDAFPRWDKEFILRARYHQKPIAEGEFVVTNPHPVSAEASWTPDLLPVTKSDGDFEVTLTKFVAGAPFPYRQSTPDPQGGISATNNDPAQQCVHLNFELRQNGQPTTNWSAWPVRTSDAAGNRVRGFLSGYPTNGIYPLYPLPSRMQPTFPLVYDGHFYYPGLWPGRSPWKVQLEFTRRSGFSADETVTFTNLSVRPGSEQDFEDEWSWDESKTNFNLIAEGKVNGVKLKLLPPLLLASQNQPGQKYISVIIYADPGPVAQKLNLKLLQATDDQGREVTTPFGSAWAGHFSLDFPNPRQDIRTLNLKLALHKSRFVEFTVKPTRP